MTITIKNMDSAINSIKNYRKTLDEKRVRFLSKLAEVGFQTASIKFLVAQYDGANDVVVQNKEWVNDHRLAIRASGTALLFIEFGSGIYYSEQHPQSTEMGMQRGTYGQGKGSQSSWGYYGEPGTNGEFVKTTDRGDVYVTHGNPPARAMYEAGKKMREQISEIAKEVYGV